ncbi:MAG: hypothetical protein EOP83_01370 [Verrucomicrobiaceae bacterium]|nr:MAG: hypothetical protein EOP83_01370 [Verrucomicrobiaceae bacterium]
MADWFQEPTVLTDPKGRAYEYPYHFYPQQHVFDGDAYYTVTDTAMRWCKQNFGYQSDAYRASAFRITFRNEIDALNFKMRWC